jgi:hypothetical protein
VVHSKSIQDAKDVNQAIERAKSAETRIAMHQASEGKLNREEMMWHTCKRLEWIKLGWSREGGMLAARVAHSTAI